MPDFMQAMRQAQEMQAKLQQMQEELSRITVTGVAGGGMVKVDANGKGEVQAVRLDRSVVSAEDTEMLEDLILVAVTDAQKKANEAAQAHMGKLTGGLNLPFKLPF